MHRIAREQLERGLGELGDEAQSEHARAFAVRKRCKKLRALIGLVGPVMSSHRAENAAFRDIARRLAGLRDAASLLEAFDAVAPAETEIAVRFAGVRAALGERAGQGDAFDAGGELAGAREALLLARDRIGTWSIEAEGFGAVAHGLLRGYRRSRRAMRLAEGESTHEHLHEWRKRLKQDLAHMRLLREVWSTQGVERTADAARASEILGLAHDLGELRGALRGMGIEPEALAPLLALIDDREIRLRAEAFALGASLYAMKPARYAEEAERRWAIWRG